MADLGLLLVWFCFLQNFSNAALNGEQLKYLDPTKLQTKTPPETQEKYALKAIARYLNDYHPVVHVKVHPELFEDNKDVFIIESDKNQLSINASTGVAAVWGFHYYLKKYCKSHIEWRGQRVAFPEQLPYVNEKIVANDRFRYYQNVCTFSYSFVWWDTEDWSKHVEWMALNGINLALVPADQEGVWKNIYREIGMTDEEINDYTTGPAFLSWLRMGNVHGWGGPLYESWHLRQRSNYDFTLDYMLKLGMVPVLPSFNGHVPMAFKRIYPNVTFYNVGKWNKFSTDYCCGLFLDPKDPLFNTIGVKFLKEITSGKELSHIYTSDPFNEVQIESWSTSLVKDTATAIFKVINDFDPVGVWMLQNWFFVHDPVLWPIKRVNTFLTTVPIGRMLVLDLQSEQFPQYNLYQMYYGQPFIWCMLHNFGGTYGLFGNTKAINTEVYETRSREDSTMIGIGITPEGINQNYVLYDLMLESAWRNGPVDLEAWAEEYAIRRYGCNETYLAWTHLMRSVYNFNGINKMRGKYVIIRRPSFKISPWAWYKSEDLIQAFKYMVFAGPKCRTYLYDLDLVDITRQVLQYRAEQIYMNLLIDKNSNRWVFRQTIHQFLDVMSDIQIITTAHEAFTGITWFKKAEAMGRGEAEIAQYLENAKNQVTLWGPNGEITDYAAKQWSILFRDYYIPRWSAFLSAAFEAKERGEYFDEKSTQRVIRNTVEAQFFRMAIKPPKQHNPYALARELYEKWSFVPNLPDLPNKVIVAKYDKVTPLPKSKVADAVTANILNITSTQRQKVWEEGYTNSPSEGYFDNTKNYTTTPEAPTNGRISELYKKFLEDNNLTPSEFWYIYAPPKNTTNC